MAAPGPLTPAAPALSLFEAHEKARWARHHYDALWPEIKALEDAERHRITVDVDADAGQYVFRVYDLPAANPDWGLRIGDCLHNARSALDYVMVRLYALVTGQDPRKVERVQFPVYDTKEKWSGAISGSELGKLPFLSGYLARVEELQPFNGQNPSIWGFNSFGLGRASLLPLALSKLSAWDNIDKHRDIHAALFTGATMLFQANPPAPAGFNFVMSTGPSYETLKDGAEVGSWTFETPLPSTWKPTEVEMKRHFPLSICIDELFPPKAVLTVLPLCLCGVDEVLKIFDPIFSEGEPPLPVTVTLGQGPN